MTRLLATFRNPMAVIFSITVFGLVFGVYFTLNRAVSTSIINKTTDNNYQETLIRLSKNNPESASVVFDENLTQNLAEKLTVLMTGGTKENLGNILPEEGLRKINQSELEKAFNDLIKTDKPIVMPVISDKELKITAVNTRQAINNYLSDVAGVFNSRLDNPAFDQTSDEVLAEALKTGNFVKALAYAEIYDKLFADLKTVWVPSSWKGVHKQWMQTFSLKSQIMAAANQVENDTIRAMIALRTYQNLFDFEDQLSAQIAGLMKKQGIK